MSTMAQGQMILTRQYQMSPMVDMVADMEVDKLADKKVDKVADF